MELAKSNSHILPFQTEHAKLSLQLDPSENQTGGISQLKAISNIIIYKPHAQKEKSCLCNHLLWTTLEVKKQMIHPSQLEASTQTKSEAVCSPQT